jgi:N-methylhydantoinase A
MFASGGAGPLHVLAIARELHIPTVVVPMFPSHFSALGMLLADERHDFIRTFYCDLASLDFDALCAVHDEMAAQAQASLRHSKGAERQLQLDLRYVGQEFTVSVPVTLAQLRKGDRVGIRTAFNRLYEHRYAHHSPDEPVEIVNIRLAMIGKRPRLNFPLLKEGRTAKPVRRRPVYFDDASKPAACPVYARSALRPGNRISGPALVEEHGTTTLLDKGDVCRVARSGELIISVGGSR